LQPAARPPRTRIGGPIGQPRSTTPAEAAWPAAALERCAELEHQLSRVMESARLKDEFVSMVSHELRGPLTAILGTARTLLRHQARLEADVVRQLLENVDCEAERLARLLDNLLELSRTEAGFGERLIRPTALRPLLVKVLAETRSRAEGRRLSLRVSHGLPPVFVDPLRLEQVVRNLLDNAVKYSPPDARVLVTARRRAHELEVAVHNDGPPLEPLVLARLFGRFYRGPAAAAHRAGTGLGLTICRRLVEAHGGKIWAESDGASGIVFRFTLPCAAETAS
jgi:two-component system sensor histidine kinase KdpD